MSAAFWLFVIWAALIALYGLSAKELPELCRWARRRWDDLHRKRNRERLAREWEQRLMLERLWTLPPYDNWRERNGLR